MPSGVKIKREFISSFTGLRFVETNFCYDSCIPQCENNFVDKDTYFGHILGTILKWYGNS